MRRAYRRNRPRCSEHLPAPLLVHLARRMQTGAEVGPRVEQPVLGPLTPQEQQTFYALLLRATASPTCTTCPEALETTLARTED